MLRADRLLAGAALAATIWIGTSSTTSASAATAYATTSDQSVTAQIDTAHDGNLAHDTLTPPLGLAWSVSLNYPNYPIVDNGRVYVTFQQPTGGYPAVAALSLATGAVVWGPTATGGHYGAQLALDGSKLFALNETGQLQAFDENWGTVAWTAQLGNQSSYMAPTAANGIVYTSAYGNISGYGMAGTLYAVRETDGVLLWTATLVDAVGAPTVSATGVYVATRCGQTYDFDPVTGGLIWQHAVPTCTSGNSATAVLAGGRLYVIAAGNGNVILDAANGTSYGPFTSSVPPAFRGSRVFFQDAYGLHAADLPGGSMAWSFSGDGALIGSPIVVNGAVYVASSKGNVFGVEAATGAQLWTSAISNPVTNGNGYGLAAGYGMLLVPGSQGLYAFGGQETLYPGDATWANVPIGQSTTPPAPFTLINNTVSGGLIPSISISGDFSQTNNCPASLAIGTSCVISVTFTPTVGGTRTGNLTVSDNAAGSPHLIALTGIPSAPGPVDHIAMTSSSASIQAGASATYAVEAYDANGTDLGNVTVASTFAIAPDGGCTGASCTATISGPHTVTATYSGKTASANLTVTPAAAAARLTITPASATIVAGGSQTYTATAADQYGNTIGDVTASTTFAFNSGPLCSANVCSSTKAFPWTIVASYGSLGTYAPLTVTPGPLTSLVLDPANTTMLASAGQSYNAWGFDQYGNDLGNLASSSTFSITPDGSCVGISCSPARAGAHTVTATHGTITGTATITATVGPPYRMVLTPANTTIPAGGSATFSAEAFDQSNNDLGDVTAQTRFNLDSATGPACAANACTTTVAPGHQVVATYQGILGYASLNVTAGPLDHITIWQGLTSVAAGSSVQFRAFGYDGYNNGLGEVTNATTFDISPDGSCTSNACSSTKAGPHTVSATDGTVTATTGLTVTAAGAATLTVSPATATIAAGQSQAYKAEAFDQYGNDAGDYTSAATFAVSPDGTCTSGTCTATKAGSHTVSASWGNASGSAALTISAGPLASLVVTPTGADIVVGQSAALTASGNDSYGNSVNLAASVTWSMSSGTPGTLSASSGATTTFHAAATSSGTGSIIAKSGSLSATVAVTVHPAAPTHLMATTNGRKVNLTWTSAAGDRGFAVYRQTGTGGFSLIALTQSTAYVDGNLGSGLIYQYYVVAVGAAGVQSSPSNTLSITVK